MFQYRLLLICGLVSFVICIILIEYVNLMKPTIEYISTNDNFIQHVGGSNNTNIFTNRKNTDSAYGHRTCKINSCNEPVTRLDPYNISGSPIQKFLPEIPVLNGSCIPLKFPDEALPRVALASHPGSGNTWTRHLIQQLSGRRI